MGNRQQQTELERAIERAHKAGIRIAGRGYRRADSARVVAVTSASEPNRWHPVAIYAAHLECDCEASQRWGKVCIHRGLVHELLAAETVERAGQVAPPAVASGGGIAPTRDNASRCGPAVFSLLR